MIEKNIRGFSLIELILTVGVISLVMVSIYVVFNKVRERSIAENELRTILQLKDGIENFYANSPNYTGLSVATLNAHNISPPSLRTSNTNELANKMGPVTLTVSTPWSITDLSYRIAYPVDISSCPYIALSLVDKFEAVQVNSNNISSKFKPNLDLETVTALCADNNGLDYVELLLDTTKFDGKATLNAVPPLAPSTRTQFTDTSSGLICNFNDAGFNYGSATIPQNIRNQVIASYRNIDNHVGRCPNSSEYNPWIDRINSEKTTNPGLTYQEIFTSIIEPELVTYGNNSYTKASRISAANSECKIAASSSYGSLATTAEYQLYSGNKCNI